MKTLKKGESAEKSTIAGEDINMVECVHATVHTSLSDGERFQMTWWVDFSDMTEAQIREAAAEHFIIKIRRTLAKVKKPANDDWNNVTFKAKDFLTQRVSKTEKLAATLATFTDEQLAALGLSRS
jgi:hypothetical protein